VTFIRACITIRPCPHERKEHAIFLKNTQIFRKTRDFCKNKGFSAVWLQLFAKKSCDFLRKTCVFCLKNCVFFLKSRDFFFSCGRDLSFIMKIDLQSFPCWWEFLWIGVLGSSACWPRRTAWCERKTRQKCRQPSPGGRLKNFENRGKSYKTFRCLLRRLPLITWLS